MFINNKIVENYSLFFRLQSNFKCNIAALTNQNK